MKTNGTYSEHLVIKKKIHTMYIKIIKILNKYKFKHRNTD